MIIYKATNKINGKIYIGQTIRTLKLRMYYHIKHGLSAFSLALKKYGRGAFEVEVVDKAQTREELNKKECYWVKHYDCVSPKGYNLKGGGNQALFSEETKRKISLSRTGEKNWSKRPEVRMKKSIMSRGENNSFYGKHHSEKTKQKLRERIGALHPCYGIVRPDVSTRNSMMVGKRNHAFGKKHTEAENQKNREAHLGEKNHRYGKHWTIEERKIISERTRAAMIIKKTQAMEKCVQY